jgi:hypothetical protein
MVTPERVGHRVVPVAAVLRHPEQATRNQEPEQPVQRIGVGADVAGKVGCAPRPTVKAIWDLELDSDSEGLVVDHPLEVFQGDDEGRRELPASEPERVADPRDRPSEP